MADGAVAICNMALAKLGGNLITSFTDGSPNADLCATFYDPVRQSELRAVDWNFAEAPFELANDSTGPTFDRDYAYTLRAEILKVRGPFPESETFLRDWRVVGRKIYTNDASPLQLLATMDVTDTNIMDANFKKMLATRLAFEMCEAVTQSNQKKAGLWEEYKEDRKVAMHSDGQERVPSDNVVDTWESCRS